jgi:hypothetical protein
MTAHDLAIEAMMMRELKATVVDATDIGTHAVERGLNGWPVFPGNGKAPAIPYPHVKGSPACKGKCGLQGHGVLDATTDLDTIIGWWGGRYRGCNILGRVPESMFVLDMDPQHGGLESLAALEKTYGPLPDTLMTFSGRGTGGWHRFYRRPPGKLSTARLGRGFDIKTHSGYVVLPPSIHPDTGKPYVCVAAPVAAPPRWLIELMAPERKPAPPRRNPYRTTFSSQFFGSPADSYCAATSWVDILGPHGWECLDIDPDADGTRWRHPTATSPSSAAIRNGCLFVFSTNTPFDITEAGNPKGYTKFKAHAVLNHGGDMSAAARAITSKDTA